MQEREQTQRWVAGAVGTIVLTGFVLFTAQSLMAAFRSSDPLLVASIVYAIPFILVPWCLIGLSYIGIALLPHGPLRAALSQHAFWLPLAIGVPLTMMGLLTLASEPGLAPPVLLLGLPPLALAAGLWLLGRLTPASKAALIARRQALDELVRLRNEGLITQQEFDTKVAEINGPYEKHPAKLHAEPPPP
jgi:hypothetical protein